MTTFSRHALFHKLTSKHFYLSALFLSIGITLDFINSQLIQTLFPARLPITDSLFLLLPYIPWTQYLSDLANLFSVVLLALFLFPKEWRQLPFVFCVLGLAYLLRSFLILLNPFGGPLGNIAHYGLTTIHQFGQFPSGHIMLVTLIYFLIPKRQQLLKLAALISVIVEIFSLLLSHGHYSIDIVGGLLISYFVYSILEKHKAELVSLDE